MGNVKRPVTLIEHLYWLRNSQIVPILRFKFCLYVSIGKTLEIYFEHVKKMLKNN